ncbi:hypothetical protein CRENBAI_006810 [Crenichthys baileyi]|uniref:Uncharacterized protein n=1 Tax=Crenichthys baileyi TaxID=28760 RepID=A0AAV9SJE5_9TELE
MEKIMQMERDYETAVRQFYCRPPPSSPGLRGAAATEQPTPGLRGAAATEQPTPGLRGAAATEQPTPGLRGAAATEQPTPELQGAAAAAADAEQPTPGLQPAVELPEGPKGGLPPLPGPEHLLSFLWGVLTELKPDTHHDTLHDTPQPNTPQPVSARSDTPQPVSARPDLNAYLPVTVQVCVPALWLPETPSVIKLNRRLLPLQHSSSCVEQSYRADPDSQLFLCKAATPLRPPAPAGATVTGHSDTRGQKLLLKPQEMRGLYKKKESPGAGLCPPLEEPSAEPGATVPGVTACKRAGRNNGRDEVLFI